MSAQEVMLGFQWLYSTLTTNTELMTAAPGGLYRGIAPPNTATPFIIMSYSAGLDVLTANAVRLFDDLTYQVKVVGPASATTSIAQAAELLDEMLARVSMATTDGGLILSCNRQTPLQVDEPVNGVLWTNIGGFYRLEIQKAS
jgi:hypothetical protein